MKKVKTLVIQPLPGIGDMVWHLRALKAIAQTSREGKISLLAHPKAQAQALLGTEPYIDQIHTLDLKHHFGLLGSLKLAYALKKLPETRVWILHHSSRYIWASWLAGFKERLGYGFGSPLMTSVKTLAVSFKKATPFERLQAFFTLYNIDLNTISQNLGVDSTARAMVAQLFSSYPRPWIVLGVGATEEKRLWPIEHFRSLALKLHSQGTVFVCGTVSEETRVQEIVQGTSAIPVTRLPLEQTCALMAESHFFVGNDSGLLNLAASLNIPSLGLFGASPPLTYVSTLHSIMPQDISAGMRGIIPEVVMARLYALNLLKL